MWRTKALEEAEAKHAKELELDFEYSVREDGLGAL